MVVLALSGAIAACGDDGDVDSGVAPEATTTLSPSGVAEPSVVVAVADRTVATAESDIAGQAVTAFGLDLFAAARSGDIESNVTISPASVAIALAMVEPGTVDAAQEQMRALLRIDDPAAFHASMNALERDLEARAPSAFNEGDDPGEVTVRVANAAYLQEGYPFENDYLDTVGSNYGPILRTVDFSPDPDGIAHEINAFVAEATNDQIVDLIADGTIKADTVLALVNALYLKASWLETFDETATTDSAFTLLGGTDVDINMMNGGSDASASGDGWVAADKSYVGGLRAQFILPDEGRFEEIAATLPTVLTEIDENRTSGAELAVPRFETRTSTELSAALNDLGLTAPYQNGGLLGIANDPRLVIDKVIHEAFVAMDEEGTEAAAATVVLAYPTSGPPSPPVPVVLDRPFFYRIIDSVSGATLFLGQVTDPTP